MALTTLSSCSTVLTIFVLPGGENIFPFIHGIVSRNA
jgi:hypothetical protein